MMHKPFLTFLQMMTVAAPVALAPLAASASALVFQGQNAALFNGANPSGNALLMASVNKPKNNGQPSTTSAFGTLSTASIIQQSVLGQISAQINTQLFNCGDSCQNTGAFDLGGGSNISYVRAGGNVTVTFVDPVNGTTTITVPSI